MEEVFCNLKFKRWPIMPKRIDNERQSMAPVSSLCMLLLVYMSNVSLLHCWARAVVISKATRKGALQSHQS